ncbi:hypothetical protein EJ04DRAFT_513002 [Polyplosphaeria fusca]|uniref:Uncharacterized protein n=1 Tax=Polyplosphaeria fusca TaxID=682080 RepID=A0A9P4QZ47_9PLEO|nr:hypothetical protein EJ04DRAFT_513002 [Polyplosphaeria fusca]
MMLTTKRKHDFLHHRYRSLFGFSDAIFTLFDNGFRFRAHSKTLLAFSASERTPFPSLSLPTTLTLTIITTFPAFSFSAADLAA